MIKDPFQHFLLKKLSVKIRTSPQMGHHYHTPSSQDLGTIEEEGIEGWLQPEVEEDLSKTVSSGYDKSHHAFLKLRRQLMPAQGGGVSLGLLGGRLTARLPSGRSTI